MKLTSFSEKALNMFSIILFIGNGILLYVLCDRLFYKSITAWLVLIWISTYIVLGTIIPPALEPLLILFVLIALNMYYLAKTKFKNIFYLLNGFAIGLAVYIKFTAVPIFLMFVILYIINGIRQKVYRPTILFFTGFVGIFLLFFFHGYNPIYTIITTKFWAEHYIQSAIMPHSLIYEVAMPLYIGFPTVVLVLASVKENIQNNVKTLECLENFLYVLTFFLAYTAYYATGYSANRYVAPYFIFLLIVLGRYVQNKTGASRLSQYNYIFVFNFLFVILTKFF
jgi:hypothetical protein